MLACTHPPGSQMTAADAKHAEYPTTHIAAHASPRLDLQARQDADASTGAQPDTCAAPGATACYAPQGGTAAGALPVFDLTACLEDGSSLSSAALAPFCEAVAACLENTGCLVVRDPRVGTAEADAFLDLMERYFGQPDAAKMPDVHPELHYQVCQPFAADSSPALHVQPLHRPCTPCMPALAEHACLRWPSSSHWLFSHALVNHQGMQSCACLVQAPARDRHTSLPQVGATPEGVEVPRCMVDPACLAAISAQRPEHRAAVPRGADPKWRFFWRLGPRPQRTDFAELNAEPVVPAGEHVRGGQPGPDPRV